MALNDLAFGAAERIGALVEALQADDCFTGQSYVAALPHAGPDAAGDVLDAGEIIVGHVMLTRCWLDTEDRLLLRPSARIPSAAFQWQRFAAHEPWMRGRVVYPDAFWKFDAVGLRGWRGAAAGIEVTTVTLGARDVAGLANFYADLLGRERPSEQRLQEDSTWVAIGDVDGGIALAIQHEPEQVRVSWPAHTTDQHMQVHLEIRVDHLDSAVAHALACGATLADSQPQNDVCVCLDPEGHPFCLWVTGA